MQNTKLAWPTSDPLMTSFPALKATVTALDPRAEPSVIF